MQDVYKRQEYEYPWLFKQSPCDTQTLLLATGYVGSALLYVGIVPVSYTHLDVYKRQIPDSGYIKNCIANRRLANSYAKVNATRLITPIDKLITT